MFEEELYCIQIHWNFALSKTLYQATVLYSQQMAFTESPSVSNNPKIPTYCLLFDFCSALLYVSFNHNVTIPALFHDKWHEKGLKKNCSAFKFTGTMHWAFALPNVTFGSLNHNVTIFTGTTVNRDELICFALCFIQSQSTMSPVPPLFCIETI